MHHPQVQSRLRPMSEIVLFIIGALVTGLVALYMVLTIRMLQREERQRDNY